MTKLEKLRNRVARELEKFDLNEVLPYLKYISAGGMNDVKSEDGQSNYYQWLTNLMKVNKPRQIVELGGAMGVSALMILAGLPKKSKLYSITLEELGLEFSFIKEKYPQLRMIIGNDLDLSSWPKDLDLEKTDIWFIDTEHEANQLRSELRIYRPFFKKGAIVLIDDIYLNDMYQVWLEITYPKLALPELHWSGFGMFIT